MTVYKQKQLLLYADIIYRQFKIFFLFIANQESYFFQGVTREVGHFKGSAPEGRNHTVERNLDGLPVVISSENGDIGIILATVGFCPELVGFAIAF